MDRRVVVESLGAPLLWDVGTEALVSYLVPWALPEGRRAVAVGTARGVVHMVDLVTGAPVGPPLVGAAEPIRALAAFPTAEGVPLLITLQGTQLRWWEALGGRPVGEPVGAGLASALAVVRMPAAAAVLAVGDQHGVVSLWDPIHRTRSGEILRRSGHPVEVMVGRGCREGELAASYQSRDGVDVWSPAARGSSPGPVLVGSDRKLVLGTGGVVGLAFLSQPDGGPDTIVVARLWLEAEQHRVITGMTVLTRTEAPPVIVTVASPQSTMRLWRPDTQDAAVLALGVRPRCVAGAGTTAVVGHDRGVRGFVLGEDSTLRR